MSDIERPPSNATNVARHELEPSLSVDPAECAREAQRVADERYAAHYAPQRTWGAFAAFCTLAAGLWLITLIPAVSARLHVTPPAVAMLMAAVVLAIGTATLCARWFGGVLGRPHRIAERIESVVTVAVIATLIFASGSAVSFFWLLSVLHLLHGAPDLQNSRFLRAVHGLASAVLAAAFWFRGQAADAAIVVFFVALALMLSWAREQSARSHLIAQAERNVLERRLKALLVERERQRIAEDIHDGLGGQLAALAWSAAALASEQPAARDELEGIAALARGGLTELRWLLTDLKCTSMSVAELAAWFRSTGERMLQPHVRYEVEHRGDATLPADICYQLSLMTREATLNAVRHGGARRVTVSIALEDELTLRVSDDGCGLAEGALEQSRGGLSHLKRRAALLGGRLSFESSDRGTHVAVTLKPTGSVALPAALRRSS